MAKIYLKIDPEVNLTYLETSQLPSGGGGSLPLGGLTDQVLQKSSDADGDVDWGDQPTKISLGLDNVNNTSDLNKPLSTAAQGALFNKEGKLANPSTEGLVLTSSVAGVRSWMALPSSSGSAKQAVNMTGNGSITSFDIAHTLDTTDVIVQVLDVSANNSNVVVDILRTSNGNVQLNFVVAPAVGTLYRVIIIG